MSNFRCLQCGSSQFDPEGYKCGKCGGAMGPRTEQCYISAETQKTLLAHADELLELGLKLEQYEPLRKGTGLEVAGLAVAVVEAIRPGTLRELVLRLRALAVPEQEILKLRLDEPEQILTYTRMDKADAASTRR
jgi:hypothetical protein